jgi:hypothetical protein
MPADVLFPFSRSLILFLQRIGDYWEWRGAKRVAARGAGQLHDPEHQPISGENLTNELYITDREDGVKPGIGRTIMAGAKYKW